jgi:proteic killer suppression protein
MRIIFTSKKMRNACSSEKEMIKAFGKDCAKKLMQRLMELDAAPTMDQIPRHARCHPLISDLKGSYAVDLVQPYRLIFKPCIGDPPLKSGGGLDLSSVDTIEIIRVIDYH